MYDVQLYDDWEGMYEKVGEVQEDELRILINSKVISSIRFKITFILYVIANLYLHTTVIVQY